MSSPRAAPSAVHLEEPARTPYVTTVLADAEGPAVAVSDWTKAVPGQIARWVARPIHLARHRRVGASPAPGRLSAGSSTWTASRSRSRCRGSWPGPARSRGPACPGDRQVQAGPPGQRGAQLNPGKPLQNLPWDGQILRTFRSRSGVAEDHGLAGGVVGAEQPDVAGAAGRRADRDRTICWNRARRGCPRRAVPVG